MLNYDDIDVFETYESVVIAGGCRLIDPKTGEFDDFYCVGCRGEGVCEDYEKAIQLQRKIKKKVLARRFFNELKN